MEPEGCTRVLAWFAVDPRTGCELRSATPSEIAAYAAQPAWHPAFRVPIMVGPVLVTERYTDCHCAACVRSAAITQQINWAFD